IDRRWVAHCSILLTPSEKALVAAIDGENLAVDEAGQIGCEEDYGIGNILRRSKPAHRDALDQCALFVRTIAGPLLLACFGAHEAGRDRVDADAVRPELVSQLARKPQQRMLACAIGLYAGERWLQRRD